MVCPNCGKANPEGSAECAGCGLLFSKWAVRAPAPHEAPAKDLPAKDASAQGASAQGAPAQGASAQSAPVQESPAYSPAKAPAPGSPLAIVIVVGLLGLGAWRVLSSKASVQTGSGPLDPTPYKAIITDLEKTLYKDERASTAAASRLEMRARQLAGKISLDSGGESAKQGSDWLMSFAEGLANQSREQSFTPASRREWTKRWEQIRSETFLRMAWFHEAVTSGQDAPATADAQAAQSLVDVHRALVGLTETGIEESRSLSADPADPEGKAKAQAWLEDWRSRVDQITKGLPPENSVPPGLWDVQQALLSAAGDLKETPDPSVLPEWVSKAKGWLEKARAGLERENSKDSGNAS